VLFVLVPMSLAAQSVINVKTPVTSEKNRQKSFRPATLALDHSARRATVSGKEIGRLEIAYDSVEKVVIEPDVRVSYSAGAALAGFAVGGALVGGRIAASIDNPADMAHTVYLEYKKPDGSAAPLVLSVEKEMCRRRWGASRTRLGTVPRSPRLPKRRRNSKSKGSLRPRYGWL